MDLFITRDRWRSRLPHWEVEGHWHFVTIRCQGSLPEPAQLKIGEIREALNRVDAQSKEFLQLQRRYFLTAEKYLDVDRGFAPFRDGQACKLCLNAFTSMEEEGWNVGEAVIMPNHLHALIRKEQGIFSLKQILQRFKGRSAKWINQHLDRSGRFWQEDWFDRWMRHEGEVEKARAYIRNNPVKAGLAGHCENYPWRINGDRAP